LGYLNPAYFNGGAMGLDQAGALAGIERDIARPLGLTAMNAAWGIHSIANANMERAMRIISVERGRDPRRHALVAFGGAGPLHACRLARALGIPRVIVPRGAGVGSALGLLYADHKVDIGVTRLLRLNQASNADIDGVFAHLNDRLKRELSGQRRGAAPSIRYGASIRYAGQGYEIRVDLPERHGGDDYPADIRAAFHAAYEKEYGYVEPDAEVEALDWYAIATFEGSRATRWVADQSPAASGDPVAGTREAYFPETGGMTAAAVVDRYRLAPGVTVEGPALIEERESTTVILPGDRASLSAQGNLIVAIGGTPS
jgi:N-methylhydantoinase A